MSGVVGALGVAGLILSDVFLQPLRMVGGIIPDCAVEERHSDRMQITQHPVERGANISDHAFMLPKEVTLRYGWSNSTFFDPGHVIEIYQLLLNLQRAREPFFILTGKRIYDNMLIEEMETETDAHMENAMVVTIHCREVIIVSTSVAAISPSSAQALPSQTGGSTSTGQQQLAPVASAPVIPGLNSPNDVAGGSALPPGALT